ncbi:MAG TPA: antibiotic biosynthesis monooxygenase family protein [Acidimicrobiia bacterium]|nr:antibiotic biosynthesis monooxygenase family protein [Acidimicrobiia bacterium]
MSDRERDAPQEIRLTVVAGTFDARPGCEAALAGVLARYVVVSRAQAGCRNIDLVLSLTAPGRFLVYEKWDAPERQQAHMESPTLAEMAAAAGPLLAAPPDFGLFEGVSAHDLT